MKTCPDCGVSTSDDAASCAKCGQSLASVQPSAAAPAGRLRRRPDGSTLLGLGGASLGLSVILLLFFIMSRGSEAYPYYAAGGSGLLALLAQGLFSLGVLMLLTGAIVRALWFLPGADSKPAP